MSQSHPLFNTAVLRGFRAFRVFRVFRVAHVTTKLQKIVWNSVKKSVEGLVLLFFFLVISMFIFSTAIFYAEQTVSEFNETTRVWMREGTPSPFQGILSSFWFTMVTLTTVGYGDFVPISGWGRFVGALAMITGPFSVRTL
jgi:voltage-gated potassium channel Kch